MSWDSDDFVPKPLGNWDDEEKATPFKVKSSWDEEEKVEETPAPAVTAPQEKQRFPQQSRKKKSGKAKQRGEDEKREQEIKKNAGKKITKEEKEKNEKAVIEADAQHIRELFPEGIDEEEEEEDSEEEEENVDDNELLFGNNDDNNNNDNNNNKNKQINSIDAFNPNSEEDFKKFAELLGKKIGAHSLSYFYLPLLKDLLVEVTKEIPPEEVKQLITSLNVIANDKIKTQNAKKEKRREKETESESGTR